MPSLRPRAPDHWPEAIVLGSWDGRAVHVWGWDGGETLPVNWLYRGFRQAPWPGSPLAGGALSSIIVELPGGRRIRPTTARLDATSGPHWLAGITALPPPGDSMAWFAGIARLAAAVLDAGCVAPLLTTERGGQVARWQPVIDATMHDVIETLAAAMPPICISGSAQDAATADADTVGTILGSFVDGLARRRLALKGWRPSLAPNRSPTASATRAVFSALASGDGALRTTSRSATEEIARLAERLERDGRRARGEPVVVPRLRLIVPDDPGDDWRVALEVVDELDPGRWCSADDVWDATPLAVEIAGDGRHLPLLASSLTDAASRAAAGVTVLADWAHQHEPSTVDLDLEAAESFLVEAPAELAARRIELIGPERLVRSHVSVRGRATAAPASDRRAGFGREAVVQWTLCASSEDGPTALSEAELARAVAAGATLLHTGRRWVRIDPAALRRATGQLDERRRDHGRVDALTLLRLAAEADADLAAADGLPAQVADAPGAVADGAWVADLLDGLPDERLREEHEPDTFVGVLRPYQRRGLAWLRFLARLGLGGCLADDMGLGKTATALAHLLDRPGPHLVVCPLSVVHNWEAEAGRFAPKLRIVVHHGAERSGRIAADAHPRLDEAFDDGPPDVVVTTYGLLARDIDHLAATPWTTVVLDEAQMVKNPSTNAARAVRQLRAEQKLALTGTPVENRLSELWAILDAVNPGLLGSRERFRHRFGKPIERDGDADAAAALRRLTQPFVLRRTKADRQLVPDLPDKIEQIAWAGLTKEQAVLYQQVVDQLLDRADAAEGMQRRGLVLAALTRLKQICNHPVHVLGDGSRLAGRSGKLARFDELVDELLDVDERALVFTQFREMGELLRRHTAERLGLRVPFLHGGVARTRRDTMVAEFQAGLGPPLLLISLKAGGTGLNLTAASQVIHYDRWWNPAVEDQATDRAWRIGQGRTVVVHKMVCEGTVEERIATMIDEKRALADAVVGSGETWLSELSTAELRQLVRLDAGARS